MERNIRVAVRVRPFNTRELESNQKTIVRVLDEQNILFDPEDDVDEFFFHGAKVKHRDLTKKVNKKLTMDFDRVFDMDAINETVYDQCIKPLVSTVMDGYNCSIFVYGATGAGKTHTMLGNDNEPGIVFLTVRELFRQMENLSAQRHFDIGISYLEVYNELVMNLLAKTAPLKLRENGHGVEVSGLRLEKIVNAEQLLNLLVVGNRNRTQHPTDANAESSRSHAIFQVHIRIVEKKTNQKKTVKLSMIDLAGSERAASTKCMGLRFKEGANINKSLLALGNCINKLADGSKHIPYRDSNLTRILKDSLGGNCQTLMIANISPSSLTYEDTYNTLKYASCAKKIRTVCRQNIVTSNMPKEYYLKKVGSLEDELFKAKELLRLKTAELEELKANRVQAIVPAKMEEETIDLGPWERRLTEAYDKLKKNREKYWMMKSKEKMLILKIKFKEQREELKRTFYYDGSSLDQDIAKIKASTDKFGKQINSQREYLTICRNDLNSSLDTVNGLLEEIKLTGLEEKLAFFVSSKVYEMELSYWKTAQDHCNKLNVLFKTENDHLNNALMLSCDLNQQSYLLMRGNNVDTGTHMQQKHERLLKLIEGKCNIKFSDDNLQDSIGKLSNLTKEANVESPAVDQKQSVMAGQKRKAYFEWDIEEQEEQLDVDMEKEIKNRKVRVLNFPPVPMFKAETANHNLNETMVLPSRNGALPLMEGVCELQDLNSTFQMPTKTVKSATVSIKTKNVLTEQNLNKIVNHPTLMNKVVKSKVFANQRDTLTRMASGRKANGENVRFSPSRVAKVNGRMPIKTFGKSATPSKNKFPIRKK